MMAAYLFKSKRRKSKSLTAQIRDAELRVLNGQRGISVHAATLVSNIHQQMTAPASLLLAGGIGFILGECTKRQTPSNCGIADTPHAAEVAPLRTALSLMTSVYTLYTAFAAGPAAEVVPSTRHAGSRK